MRKKRRQGKPKRTKKKENRSTTEPLGQDLPRELIAAIKPTAAHLHYSAAPTPSEEQIWARLAEAPLREIRRWLTQGERRKGLLLQQFPYLEAISYSQPATLEEKKLAYIEYVIDHLKLQIALRARKQPESSTAVPADQREDIATNVQSSGSKIQSPRDLIVKNRRAVLGDMLKSGRRQATEKICGKWDFFEIPVPEPWRLEFGVQNWVDAYKNKRIRENRLYQLISVDIKKITSKS